MWTDLLELRIAVQVCSSAIIAAAEPLCQGCLTNANRMPKVDTFESFASDPLVSQKLEEAQQVNVGGVGVY